MSKRAKRLSRKSEFFIAMVGVLMIVGVISLIVALAFTKLNGADSEINNTESTEEAEVSEEPEEPEPLKPIELDFQPVIDSWVKSVGGNRSVIVYDLDLQKIVGAYNTNENYNTASLYKLFPVYEGYKRVNSGEWDGGAKAGYTGKTIFKCLDLAIRESDSTCAETIWGMIGNKTLQNIIVNEWGIANSNISSSISNANDIMLIMKRFYEHPDFDDPKLVEAMWDSFLNQPETTYDWRQGLPSGFTRAEVYDKVGWAYNANGKYWNIYHDAAIVKFPLDDGTTRNFVVVVMSNKVDYKNIRKLGTMLETEFYQKAGI